MAVRITRRDFLNGMAIGAGASLIAPADLLAQVDPTAVMTSASSVYYLPTLTGMRGSHAGSFEVAHALAWSGGKPAEYRGVSGSDQRMSLFDQDLSTLPRARSWGNLMILNEWHWRYGDTAPMAVHEQYWQTRLVCPGGGDYVWNEEFKTMESTVFGCPARPKQPASLATPLTKIKQLGMGLTFEDNGLRAKVELTR